MKYPYNYTRSHFICQNLEYKEGQEWTQCAFFRQNMCSLDSGDKKRDLWLRFPQGRGQANDLMPLLPLSPSESAAAAAVGWPPAAPPTPAGLPSTARGAAQPLRHLSLSRRVQGGGGGQRDLSLPKTLKPSFFCHRARWRALTLSWRCMKRNDFLGQWALPKRHLVLTKSHVATLAYGRSFNAPCPAP